MSILSPAQLLFVMRVTGKNVESNLSALASDLALKSGLDYDENGKIHLRESVDPKEILLRLQSIGMRIPKKIREEPVEILELFQKHGRMYSQFNSAKTELYRDQWLPRLSKEYFVNKPIVTGTDIYLNPYLENHLRDLYTDFDLFDLFPDLSPELENREDLINVLIKKYHPAGEFWFSFYLDGSISLIHEYLGENQTYTTIQGIKSISFQGKIFFRETPLPHIGLYQLAFLCKPEYAQKIYRVELTDQQLEYLQEVYKHLLSEIKLAEQSGEQKIRFSPTFSEFNVDLK